ncbi:MAG: SHOCT domain-containing protein [Pseudonocardiaceae bacterium]
MMFGWMWTRPVLMLGGLALVVYGAVRLAQGWSLVPTGGGRDSLARQVLDGRFARGESAEGDYQRRRARL